MAQTALTLATQLLERIRDPQGSGTSQALAIQVLSQCQAIVNGGVEAVIESANLVTVARKCIYPISVNFPAALRIVSVHTNYALSLDPLKFTNLADVDRGWFRAIGSEFTAWTTIGRDLLVVWPSLSTASNVVVKYTKITNPLVLPGDLTEVPDDVLPIVLDLAEAVLLTKTRDFTGIGPALGRVQARTVEEREELRRSRGD